jgi:hypothetical protein
MRMDPFRSDQIHHGRKVQGTGKLAYQAAFVKELIRQPGLSPLLLRCLVQRSVSKTWEGYSGSTAAVSRSRKGQHKLWNRSGQLPGSGKSGVGGAWGVSGHLKVAGAMERNAGLLSCNHDCAFPIAGPELAGELLVAEGRGDRALHAESRNRDLPAQRISAFGLGAYPKITVGPHGEIGRGQEGGSAARVDVAAGREGIDCAIFVAHAIEHQLGVVVELEADPVPTAFVR